MTRMARMTRTEAAETSGTDVAAASGESASGESALLRAVAIHKSFGETAALRGASVSVAAGEIVAVMGPSGSGKSTLLHCVAGIITTDHGQVGYAGTDLTDLSDARRTALRRSEFGFVFQFGQLVPELSCVENVALPLRLDGMRRKQSENVARRIMERLQVDDLATHRPGEVSGGQSQRVAVARALVTEPRVIFADEPTGALDSLNGERVMNQLVDTARDSGAAVVLVTHDPKVAAYSDREVIVRDGETRDIGGAA